jgi:hypothetical protein
MNQAKVLFLISYTFILLIPNNSFCQNYFSKRYDLNNDAVWDYSGDIIQLQDEYTIRCEGQVVWDVGHRRIGFLHLDSVGNPIGGYKIYQDSIYSIGSGYPGSFIHLSNSIGFALVGFKSIYVSGGRYDRGLLMRLDQNLDTLWTKLYRDDAPNDTSFMFRNLREMPDKGFIIVGGHNRVDGTGFIRIDLNQVDSLGNLIWRRYYGTGNSDFYPSDITLTSDGGYAIG